MCNRACAAFTPLHHLQVTEDDEGVSIETVHGKHIRCKLLIGADGNRSMTRAYVNPKAQLQYAGAAVWRFFIDVENPFVSEGECLVLSGGAKVITCQRVRQGGRPVTYCSGLSQYPEEQLEHLNQTRCV